METAVLIIFGMIGGIIITLCLIALCASGDDIAEACEPEDDRPRCAECDSNRAPVLLYGRHMCVACVCRLGRASIAITKHGDVHEAEITARQTLRPSEQQHVQSWYGCCGSPRKEEEK